jgi:L-malate glycosyltransferase
MQTKQGVDLVKILTLIENLENDGTSNVIKGIILNLNPKKYENVIVCIKQPYKDDEMRKTRVYELKNRLGMWKYLPFKIIKLSYETSKIIKKEKPDIIHMHSPGALCRGVLASMLSDVPVKIYTYHHTLDSIRPKESFILRLFMHKMSKITAVAKKVREGIINKLKINPSRIEVIINGINPEKFNKKTDEHEIRKSIGLDEKDKIVSIVAELREDKDHITLIRAFSKVAEKEKYAKLLIIGPDKENLKERIRKEIHRNHLENKAILLGERKDIPEILRITDVSALSSSSHEATSMFLLESMASSKAVVATDVGGNPEIVEDGVNGFIIRPRNPSEMAEAIIKLLADKKLRDKMGREGKKKVKNT